ncbi:S8 family serine peptidase [Chloroflexota bacterium]
MKKTNIFGLILIAVLALSNIGSVRTPDLPFPNGWDAEWFAHLRDLLSSGDIFPDQLVIKIQPGINLETIKNCAGISGTSSIQANTTLGFKLLDLHEHPLLETIQAIISCPGVIYVEPNYLYSIADTIPNDQYFSPDQYGLVNIRAPQGWDISTGSTSTVIAILDTGADLNHPDLASKIISGYDFVNDDGFPQDDNGHGSHVSGIAAAVTDNGIGVAGVSWGARIMPVKVLNSEGIGSSTDISEAIIWAADQGADVINMSFGSPSPSTIIEDAINYAHSKGVTLVAAVGNAGRKLPHDECSFLGCTEYNFYPAAFDHVIAVGAVDNTNTRVEFSNFGSPLDVMAPGVNIWSTYFLPSDPEVDYFASASGTSMSSPFVAGLAGILSGLSGGNSPEGIEQAIKDSALDLGTTGRDDLYGYGLIQVDGAIQELLSPPMPGDFEKMEPADRSFDQSTNPRLSWSFSSDVASFQYCIDKSNDDACDGDWISAGTELAVDLQVESDSIYYWQVRSTNGVGTVFADADHWNSFTTVNCSVLEVTIKQEGRGAVGVDPAPDCQDGSKYTYGTEVMLTAIPATNFYQFVEWSGDVSGEQTTNTIKMISDHAVTVNFEKAAFNDVPFDYSEKLGERIYYLHDHIQALYNHGLSAGTSTDPAIFSPGLNLDRAMAAVFILRANFGVGYVPPFPPYNTFASDDWTLNDWA